MGGTEGDVQVIPHNCRVKFGVCYQAVLTIQ